MNVDGIEVENLSVEVTGIASGDLYVAKRNTGWKLLECVRVHDDFVIPKSLDYFFDTHECYKVVQSQ